MELMVFIIAVIMTIAVGIYMVSTSIVTIGDDEVGIVFKKTALRVFRRPLAGHHLIARDGEAGWQADTLAPGFHPGFWRWMYRVHKVPVIQIPPGEIGLVIANDGAPLPPERQLGRIVDCDHFQDAREFLTNGGQKGRQLGILTTGTYRINTELFTIVTTANATQHGLQPDDLRVYVVATGNVGVVTALEGTHIPTGDIAGPAVPGHNAFQSGQQFIDAGGCKGLQEEVLQAGAYHLNPWFVRVEPMPLTYIPPGTVGVIISHVGKTLMNNVGDDLVEPGYKGVWRTPLLPGQHPLNPKVLDVEIVPTFEITLDWSDKAKPDWHYDAPLHAISLRSNDGHIFDIEVTQVISIRSEDAPRMILRVGSIAARQIDQQSDAPANAPRYRSIRNLVMRVLEPMIGNHFRNSAQDYGVLDFLTNRGERQREAVEHIKAALKIYGVQAVGTFINEIDLPDDIEQSLQARKLAEVERETLQVKRATEDERQHLVEKQAQIDQQQQIVQAQTDAAIAPYLAEVHRMKAEAEAEAHRLRSKVEAEALRERTKIEVEMIQQVVETLGQEGYLRREQIEQIARINLPNTILGNTGLLEPLFAHVVGNITGQVPAPPQTDATTLADRVIQFLQENPAELQVVLKRLTDQVQPVDVIETDAPRSLPRVSPEPTLQAVTDEAPVVADPPIMGSKTCPNCSSTLPIRAVFCPNCGHRVRQ